MKLDEIKNLAEGIAPVIDQRIRDGIQLLADRIVELTKQNSRLEKRIADLEVAIKQHASFREAGKQEVGLGQGEHAIPADDLALGEHR